MNHNPILFSGNASKGFAAHIASQSGLPDGTIRFGEIYHHTFPSGESYCQLHESIRGEDVFLVNSIVHPANTNFMELAVMADAARRASAGRITAVIPYFGYSRQDRKDKPRVPITMRLIMDMLEAAGVNRFLTMDLHAQQEVGFTNLPVDQLVFLPELKKTMNKSTQVATDVILAPDIGSVKRAELACKAFDLPLAIIRKIRKSDSDVEVATFIGDVKDRNVLIIDDLTESCGTLIEAATACRKEGANRILCAVTHGCFNEDVAFERLQKAFQYGIIDKFYVSNTAPIPFSIWSSIQGVVVVDVAPLFAQAILRIHNNESVSQLFV